MKDRIKDFLKKVLYKPLITDELTYALEGGKLEGVYSDKMTFSELQCSENGMQFNMTVVTEEKVYQKDETGKRVRLVKDFTGAGVFHYEFAYRKSTNEFTGYMRLLSSSTPDHTMDAVVYGVYGIEVEDNELKWKEQQLLYRDMPKGENGFRSVAFDSEIRFYQENEKLRFEYIPIYHDYDAKSMTKTLSEDYYPPFVAKEK